MTATHSLTRPTNTEACSLAARNLDLEYKYVDIQVPSSDSLRASGPTGGRRHAGAPRKLSGWAGARLG